MSILTFLLDKKEKQVTETEKEDTIELLRDFLFSNTVRKIDIEIDRAPIEGGIGGTTHRVNSIEIKCTTERGK